MKAPVSNEDRTIDLNMTSMIDVIFLLLVFFVFTADFDRLEKLLPMNLALAGKVERLDAPKPTESEPERVKIRILRLNDTQVGWQVGVERLTDRSALAGRLRNCAGRRSTVIIAPDGDVAIEKALDVYDLCRGAGLKNIQFSAKKP